MSRVELSKAMIQRAAKDAKEHDLSRAILRDQRAPGLSAIITGDTVRLEYSYRPRGQQPDGKRWPIRYVSIGYWPTVSLIDARAKVQSIKGAVAEGRDPAAELKDDRRARVDARHSAVTVAQAIDNYVATRLSSGTQHHKTETLQLRLAAREANILEFDVRVIARSQLICLETIHAQRPATARGRIGAIKRFFGELARRELIETDPTVELRLPAPPRARRLQLDGSDVQALWNADHSKQAFVRLMILVPLRYSAMAGLGLDNMRDSWLHFDKLKNGDSFEIPLSQPARQIIEGITPRNDRYFNGMGARTRITNQLRVASGVDYFAWHDLRRLFATTLADHDVGDPDLVDGLLSHRQSETRGGVRGAYQQSGRRRAKEHVMETWGRMVISAATTGKWMPGEGAGDSNIIALEA